MKLSRNILMLLFCIVLVIFIVWPLISSLILLVALVALTVVAFAIISSIILIPVASIKMLWEIIFKDGF